MHWCLSQTVIYHVAEDIIPNVSNENPMYYNSNKQSKTQCKWSAVEKEAYAIHFALQKLLVHYLHGA